MTQSRGFPDDLRVVAVVPPIHDGFQGVVVLSSASSPVPELESRLGGWGSQKE